VFSGKVYQIQIIKTHETGSFLLLLDVVSDPDISPAGEMSADSHIGSNLLNIVCNISSPCKSVPISQHPCRLSKRKTTVKT
jgi:hypothetical protein